MQCHANQLYSENIKSMKDHSPTVKHILPQILMLPLEKRSPEGDILEGVNSSHVSVSLSVSYLSDLIDFHLHLATFLWQL